MEVSGGRAGEIVCGCLLPGEWMRNRKKEKENKREGIKRERN